MPYDPEADQNLGTMLIAAAIAKSDKRGSPKPLRRRSRVFNILAQGDSWFEYSQLDVVTELADQFGHSVESVAKDGRLLADMARNDRLLNQLVRAMKDMVNARRAPDCVILSGGGNDLVVKTVMRRLLNAPGGPGPALNSALFKVFLDTTIRQNLVTLVTAINVASERLIGRKVPVFIHGYAHAVPDGKGAGLLDLDMVGPWLRPEFVAAGFEKPKGNTNLAQTRIIVAEMIDALNVYIADLCQTGPFANLHHIDARPFFPAGAPHRTWWDNELHPSSKGFRAVAKLFDARLQAVIP